MLKQNRFTYLILLILTVFILPASLYSESIFMNDGTIIEGTINKGDDEKIQVANITGETRELQRKEIIRIIFHNRYKNKKYLTKTDGTNIEGYIVHEDNDNIIIRNVLNSSSEITISRNDIGTISDNKPE